MNHETEPSRRAAGITIAVSGHRPNRMQAGAPVIARRLCLVMRALARGARRGQPPGVRAHAPDNAPDRPRARPHAPARPHAVSPLAEGSDRLFAEAALASGFVLDALLPFAKDDYVQTFDEPDAPAFQSLLARAASCDELPGSLSDTKSAYMALGGVLVARCDLLVTVWDGAGAAGLGGTPDVIAMALDAGLPVIWIDASEDRPVRLMVWRGASGRPPPELQVLARRARAISVSRIARLGSCLTPPA